jgi:hypothetical protein
MTVQNFRDGRRQCAAASLASLGSASNENDVSATALGREGRPLFKSRLAAQALPSLPDLP